MPGHSPQPTVDAIIRRVSDLGGITTMMPSEDAVAVGEQLARRFGLPAWQFALSATDANRFALRMCRQVQGPTPQQDHDLPARLPRDRRRDGGDAGCRRPRRGARGQRRRAGRPGADDQGGGLQRPRRGARRAGARGRRVRARRAGDDQRRHGPARARVPEGVGGGVCARRARC